jgi:hypothetical protein
MNQEILEPLKYPFYGNLLNISGNEEFLQKNQVSGGGEATPAFMGAFKEVGFSLNNSTLSA